MANRYPTFFTRDPVAGLFWCVAGTVGLVNSGRSASPWIFLISYKNTERMKIFMWLGAGALVAAVSLYQFLTEETPTNWLVRLIPILILSFFWVLFLTKSGVTKLADEVTDLGDRLTFRRGKTVQTVLLSKISSVAVAPSVSMSKIVVNFYDQEALGRSLAFLPRFDPGSNAWSIAVATRTAFDLNRRVQAARAAS